MALLLLASATVTTGGCAADAWRTPAGAVITGKINFQKEPDTGWTYHLYVPKSYTPTRSYPLVITAHGTFPFDHALMQRDRWTKVAERYGMIVCAPDFDSANGLLSVPLNRPVPELLRDEKATLRIIDELERRYNINRDAIMITGWSGGGYPAHFIGLRHPDLFRCIVGRAANFSMNLVSDAFADRARHMHVYVFYGSADLPGFGGINGDAQFWYRLHRFQNFEIRRLNGGHDPHQDEAARYFDDIIKHWPTVHVNAIRRASDAPLTVRFRADVRCSNSPGGRVETLLWDFGDGQRAAGQAVTHTFRRPGTYKVFLTVTDAAGYRECAQKWLKVQ